MPTPPLKSSLLIIDGHALLHRAWHAIPHLTTKKGEMVNAVYGFTMIMMRAIMLLRPTHVVATFDRPGPTFRHEAYGEYKATREKKSDELYGQIGRIQEVLTACGIPIFEKDGYEADDVIATINDRAKTEDASLEVMILSGDMDILQLVDARTHMYTPKKGVSDITVYDDVAVAEKYGGLTPHQIAEYKALRGDVSDNIKGVKGIGEKTAIQLLTRFGSVAGIYDALATDDPAVEVAIGGRIAQLLRTYETDARQSLALVQLVRDVPIDFSLDDACLGDIPYDRVVTLFTELEFKSLIPKLAVFTGREGDAGEVVSDVATDAALSAATRPHNDDYHLVENVEDIDALLARLEVQHEWALDTETKSLETMDATLLGVSVSMQEGEAYYIVWAAMSEAQRARLKALLEDPAYHKTGHNIKYDYEVLAREGIVVRGISFDSMIGAYILNPGDRTYGLDELTFAEFGYQKIATEDLLGKKGPEQLTMDQVSLEKLSQYACEDADFTWRLMGRLRTELEKQGQMALLEKFELPLIPVLAAMEMRGCKLDTAFLGVLATRCQEERIRLTAEIYALAGHEFNIDSPLQLKKVLFEELKLSPLRIKKGKTGLSTAASELEKMADAHEIVGKILDYREVTKLSNTYLEVLPILVNLGTGRVHAKFNQTVAATGRLSSSQPNLQNIPIKTSLGREVRKAFVAESGNILLAADYSQIELRIVASLAQDAKMIEAFTQGLDIHTATAAEMNGVALDAVTKDMRRAAKAINFGVLYGMGPQGIAQSAGIPYPQAKEFLEKYFATYPAVRTYLDTTIALTRSLGYVETYFGRRRYLPDIDSRIATLRASAERAATNMPIQGTNADVIKLAMIAIHARLADEFGGDASMILQVHDELVFEVKESEASRLAVMVREEMEHVVHMAVPFVVEVKTGTSWGEMAPLV